MAETNLTTERWLPVADFPEYEVSDAGRIRRDGSLIRVFRNKKGYEGVCLRCRGGRTTRLVHRIVMEAFVGVRPAGMVVNHLNSVRHDNRLANLEYTTQKLNVRQGMARLGRWGQNGEAHGGCVLSEGAVREIRDRLSAGELRSSIARAFGTSYWTVRDIDTRKRWKHV